MSSRPHPALFEATRSALLLPRQAADRIPARVDPAESCKSNLDKSFGLPDLSRFPEGIPI